MKSKSRAGYEGVAVAVPVTVPYARHSIQSAHWWLARALGQLLQDSGLRKQDIDGACVSSFLLFPDTAVGLMQHLGLTVRWLDHIPMGGASGVVAQRRGRDIEIRIRRKETAPIVIPYVHGLGRAIGLARRVLRV
ncbi:MAG: hypothetical protein ACO3Q7_12490, partial [Steroidobacteraceae bacterium]